MKSLGKNAQGAMEYLMTYGWAILVVMIVGVVLWNIGIFDDAGITRATGRSIGFSTYRIGAIDASIKCTTSNLTVILTNQAGVTLTNIDVTPSQSCYDTKPVNAFGDGAFVNSILRIEEKGTLVITASTPPIVEDKITTVLNVTFTERIMGRSITRRQQGTIACAVES